MNLVINGHLIGEERERGRESAKSRKTFRLSKMSALSLKLGPSIMGRDGAAKEERGIYSCIRRRE